MLGGTDLNEDRRDRYTERKFSSRWQNKNIRRNSKSLSLSSEEPPDLVSLNGCRETDETYGNGRVS